MFGIFFRNVAKDNFEETPLSPFLKGLVFSQSDIA
jgi:hypothetical protein